MSGYFFMNSHPMPGHWKWLLPDEIKKLKVPLETRSDCSNCPSQVNGYTHEAHCCTYRPQISNFLTAFALKDGAISKKRFSQLKSLGVFFPIATLETPYATIQQDTLREEDPDKLPVCHFWEKAKGCSIHKFRNHICSSFFCFTMAGRENNFWLELADYVMMLENNIGWWVLSECGYDINLFLEKLEEIDANSSESLNWSEEHLKEIWGQWYGKEEEFYSRCHNLVNSKTADLYELAFSFLDKCDNGFRQKVLDLNQGETNTHLPFSSKEIEAKRSLLIKEYMEIDENRYSGLERYELTPYTVIKSSVELTELAGNFPKAECFLILSPPETEDVDFQPLSSEEYSFIKLLLEGGEVSKSIEKLSDLDIDVLTLVSGLKIRGFLTSAPI